MAHVARSPAALAASLFAAWLALAVPVAATGRMVDGTVAAVERRTVALSLLEAYRVGIAPGLAPEAALQALIDDRLLAREATRYGQALAKNELASAEKAHPAPPGLTKEEWEALLGDHLIAQHFLSFRFGDYVPVSQEEIRAAYDTRRSEFAGQPFAAVEDRLRQSLMPAVRAKRQADFVAGLRTRTAIQINRELLPAR